MVDDQRLVRAGGFGRLERQQAGEVVADLGAVRGVAGALGADGDRFSDFDTTSTANVMRSFDQGAGTFTYSQPDGTMVSGTWTLAKAEPPVAAGRGGRGGAGGGGIAGPYADTIFAQAPAAVTITQTGTMVSIEVGGKTARYTLDGRTTAIPEGDVSALKTRAHWDGAKLHLHFKQGMNWGRDVLSANGGTLTIVRDLESGGQSTTRTMTYSKTS